MNSPDQHSLLVSYAKGADDIFSIEYAFQCDTRFTKDTLVAKSYGKIACLGLLISFSCRSIDF